MAEQNEEQESGEAQPEAQSAEPAWRRGAQRSVRAIRAALPRVGLWLFMLLLPLLLVTYPAWLLASRLMDYEAAAMVEAELTRIEINAVEMGRDRKNLFEARRHYDVVFSLKGADGKHYASLAEMSWPAPGLKRRLASRYPLGETYTLYALPNKAMELEDVVATQVFYRLAGLMALLFAGSLVFFLLWKRLAQRMPTQFSGYPHATAMSLLAGQLLTLLLTGLLAVAMSFAPLVIPSMLFVAGYLGLAVLLSLTLRLLIFEDAPAPQPVPQAQEEAGSSRTARR